MRFPFRFLTDTGPVGRSYGVWDELWKIQQRATFIVDRRGSIRWVDAGGACIETARTLEALTRLAAAR